MNEEEMDPRQAAGAPSEPAGSEGYASKRDVDELREMLQSVLESQHGEGRGYEPEDDDDGDEYGRYLEDRITNRIGSMLEQALGPLMGQNAFGHISRGIDSNAVAEYTDGLSAADLAFIAKHPGLSRAIREAAHAKSRGPISPVSALRDAESYDSDAPDDPADDRARREALSSLFGGSAVKAHFDGRRGR